MEYPPKLQEERKGILLENKELEHIIAVHKNNFNA